MALGNVRGFRQIGDSRLTAGCAERVKCAYEHRIGPAARQPLEEERVQQRCGGIRVPLGSKLGFELLDLRTKDPLGWGRQAAQFREVGTRERANAAKLEPHTAHSDPTVLLDPDWDQPLRVEVRRRDLGGGAAYDLTDIGCPEVEDKVGTRIDEHLNAKIHALARLVGDKPIALDEVPQLGRGLAENVHQPQPIRERKATSGWADS